MTMGETISEYDGKKLIPPMTRTDTGWAEQRPTPCPVCDTAENMIGWLACACRRDTLMGGHRTWICQRCGHRRVLGCLGETPGAVR
ncbi:hypothetical protein [Brachybacterium subflavum]|uniref:hypothetical protein n=1 Tax=Brachybacterium subflavum TaxID=2585206 RepID=UPI0012664E8A|nr:hypothetical protein [Brachybacterium subflavum]